MNPRESSSTGAVIASYLEAADIRTIFTYPGDPTIDFMESCRTAGIDVVLATREGTAAFMAESYGTLTGRPGVCLSTLGPGSTALLNGVAAAQLDRVPMVAISGQITSRLENVFTHQVVDHGRLFSSVTKWAGRVESGSVDATMRKALRLATAERPGAVHLTCGTDVFSTPAPDLPISVPPMHPTLSFPTVHVGRGDSDPTALLAGSRRPVLLAGTAAVRSAATAELMQLAEALSAPVVVAPMSKGVFPEDHPLFAGVLDMACNTIVWDFLASADLIVTVGFDPVELIKPWQLQVPVLHIDTTPNIDQIYPSGCEVVGDIRAACSWLAESWKGEPRWDEPTIAAHRARLREGYYAGAVSGALNPTDVVDVARGWAKPDTIVSTDVGSHKLLVGQGWVSTRPRRLLMTNGLSAMGFGLPAAIAAKLIDPTSSTIALIGDGGFAMVAPELFLAAERHLGIVVIVFCDGSLNRIELKQLSRNLPSTATRIGELHVADVAEAFGCIGVRARGVAELQAALEEAVELDRPLVIEARIDPSQYLSQF